MGAGFVCGTDGAANSAATHTADNPSKAETVMVVCFVMFICRDAGPNLTSHQFDKEFLPAFAGVDSVSFTKFWRIVR